MMDSVFAGNFLYFLNWYNECVLLLWLWTLLCKKRIIGKPNLEATNVLISVLSLTMYQIWCNIWKDNTDLSFSKLTFQSITFDSVSLLSYWEEKMKDFKQLVILLTIATSSDVDNSCPSNAAKGPNAYLFL